MRFSDKKFWKENKTGLALRLLSHFGMFIIGFFLVLQCIDIIEADFTVATTISLLQFFSSIMILSVLIDISSLMFLNYLFPLKPCKHR